MSGNKPAGQDTSQEIWDAYVAMFRGPEDVLDLTTPCLEYQCFRVDDIGRTFQELKYESLD